MYFYLDTGVGILSFMVRDERFAVAVEVDTTKIDDIIHQGKIFLILFHLDISHQFAVLYYNWAHNLHSFFFSCPVNSNVVFPECGTCYASASLITLTGWIWHSLMALCTWLCHLDLQQHSPSQQRRNESRQALLMNSWWMHCSMMCPGLWLSCLRTWCKTSRWKEDP